MIRINQNGGLQKFALTLTELSTLESPFFLFEFTHEETGQIQTIVLPDTSANKQRLNLFEIAGNWFTGEGWHRYRVFEQTNLINQNTALAKGIVEVGRLYVFNPLTDTNYNQYAGN